MKHFCTMTAAVAFVLILGLQSRLSAQNLISFDGEGPTFIKGANLPWLDGAYSNYLGLDPHHPTWGIYYNSASMHLHFADMHKMGINVCRMWINQDDMGCTINSLGETTGVTSTFWNSLDSTVYHAGQTGVHLYLTLNNGRTDFLENPALAQFYIDNCLVPLVKRYKGNKSIFAIDIMNEVDGCVGGSEGNYGVGATWPQAQALIKTFAAAIHKADPTRLCSCSTGWHSWHNISYFKGLGLDFYDFHLYDDNQIMPSASSLGMDKPIYIGESGQSTGSWSDSIQDICEWDGLNNAASNGYAGLGIWAYQYPAAGDYHQMLEPGGAWRPVCYTIEDWNYSGDTNLVPNGTYTLTNENSSLVLNVPGNSQTKGVQLNQSINTGSNGEKFTLTNLGGNIVSVVNVNSGLALDDDGWSTASGAIVDQWTYFSNVNQQWQVSGGADGYFLLTNVYSGMALDIQSASKLNGADAVQEPYNDGLDQLWKIH